MPEKLSVWSFGAPVYLPSLLFGIGQGAAAPVIPLSVREHGGSVALASLVVAVLGVGRVIGNLPAGVLVLRIGERRAMILAAGVAAAALGVCIAATSLWVLAVAVGVTGMTTAVFGLARHAYLTEAVPYRLRARAMSALGGTHRIGLFVGPFLGAALAHTTGTDGGYWVHLGAALVAGITVLVLPDVAHEQPTHHDQPRPSTYRTIRQHLPVLRTLGMGAVLIGAVRASRQVVIPLWADHIGLDPATISVIFGIAGAVDMLLFYPAGWIMDRIGRSWVVVPSMTILGLAHVILPFATTTASLTAVAIVMGVGNGIGSGTIMTLGSDVSPETNRAVFLGAWRLCSDFGNGVGPLFLGAVSTLTALGPAAIAMGGIAGVGALAMARWIPKYGGPP